MLELIIWFLLIVIGVSDAQKQRIPNKAVLLLLGVITASLMYETDTSGVEHLYGGLLSFAVCFVLYLLKIMAGGDVKLLTAIGVWLGAETMWQVTPYIIIAGGVIGIFYLALFIASTYDSFLLQIKAYAIQKVTPGWKSKQPLVIPFAPAIVIGLAYFFYVH